MGRDDWYRNRAWSPEIETELNRRIARSRHAWNKWQYFSIQAGTLARNWHSAVCEDSKEE
jgi:hypothetical protein